MSYEVSESVIKPPGKRARTVNKRRATLIFKDRFEAVYDELEKRAKAEDRDLDTFILRTLEGAVKAKE